MNKFTADHARKVAERGKACALGKIGEDINARLPEPPEPLTAWDKLKLISSGEAALRKDIKKKEVEPNYSGDALRLVDAFVYPVSNEKSAYDTAYKSVQAEKHDRELAVELAFNRAVDERICGLLDSKGFLDKIEELSSQNW